VTDEYFNNVVLDPPPEAIEEFNISKTNYSAEFGGKSGGVINVLTRSGTNRFHSSFYEFLRNDIFNAKNFFAIANQSTPPFRENQFGGSLGGPLARDKTFFFIDYGGVQVRKSLSHLFGVPMFAQRSGVFSTTINNPFTGAPFPGNTINLPLDSAAEALLSRVPLPNLSGNSSNLLAVDKQDNRNNQGSVRVDHQFSSHDSAYLRASVFDANEVDPFGSSVLNEALLPGFGRALTTHSVSLSVGETHIFSPSFLNEFRFGWLNVSGGQSDPNAGNNFASQYGTVSAARPKILPILDSLKFPLVICSRPWVAPRALLLGPIGISSCTTTSVSSVGTTPSSLGHIFSTSASIPLTRTMHGAFLRLAAPTQAMPSPISS
jgi:hypothetical protein